MGLVNAKDLLSLAIDDVELLDAIELARPLGHVSESARIDEVLREMRRRRVHLALVHDSHEVVVGLLTMEDILEELVGEIEDEFDRGGAGSPREVSAASADRRSRRSARAEVRIASARDPAITLRDTPSGGCQRSLEQHLRRDVAEDRPRARLDGGTGQAGDRARSRG